MVTLWLRHTLTPETGTIPLLHVLFEFQLPLAVDEKQPSTPLILPKTNG